MFMPMEFIHDEHTWHSASAIMRQVKIRRRSARRNDALRHNNGMHPTANSVVFIRKTWMVSRLNARRVMPGVRCFISAT